MSSHKSFSDPEELKDHQSYGNYNYTRRNTIG